MDRKAVSSCDESDYIVAGERITALSKFKVKVVDIVENNSASCRILGLDELGSRIIVFLVSIELLVFVFKPRNDL